MVCERKEVRRCVTGYAMQSKTLLILGLLVVHASSYQIFVKVQSIRFVATVEGEPEAVL